MASIKDLISSLKKTKDKAISDNEGWIRQNKFTPVKQVQQMGQNLSAWGNIANQGIKNQIDIQKRDFNQYLWKPLKENPVLTPTLNRFEQATPAIGNQLRQLNPFSPKQTPQQNWQDTKKIGAAALTAYGLAKAPFAAMMGGAVINPIVKLGTNVYQNKKGEQLNKQLSQIGQSRTDVPLFAQQKPYQQKKITEGVVNAIPEGAGTGLANAGTTRLTNYLVQSLSKTLPFLKPLTEEAIKKSAPVVTDTTKEAVKKVFDVGTKRLVKAAVIETAVESPIWATLTQTEQESYIQALMRETEQNLIMNIGMAGVNTLGDSKAMLPIINKTIKETVNNAFYNPDGSLKMRSGATRLLTPDISTPEVKTGGVSTPQNKGNKYSFANTNYGIQKNNDGSFSVKEDRIGNSTKTLLEQKIPDDLGKEYQDLLNQKDALKGSGLSTEATNKRMDIQNKLGDLTDRIIRKLGLEDLGIVISKDGKIIRDNIDGEANKLAEELYKIGKLTPELTKQFQENPKQFLLDNSKSQISPEVKTGEGGKTFYHGTKADFDKFDDTKLGSNTEWLNSKWGHFFSDDKNIAKRFLDEDSVQLKDTRTGRIIEAELDIKKPLDFTPEGLTTKKEQAQIIYEGMTGKKVSPEKALGYLKDAYDEAINSGGITDFYDELYSTLKIKELAKQKGYDGIISHYGELDGKKIKEYGVFSSNQIKIKPPIKTGEVSTPEVKTGKIKIINPGASGEVPKIKITKKTPEPYIDAQGELQFPGGPKKIEPFAKPDLDISDEAKGTASIIGGSSGIKASPEVKEYFANWTNARRASQVEGILKSREFTDLDSKGIEGILEFQAGNKTGRFSDVKNYFDNKFTQAKNEGLKLNYKQDYLPQMWLNPKGEVEAVFGNRLGLNPSFTFESIMKNYQEGIEAGLTPRFSKLSDLIGSYESRVNKSLADRKFFIRLKEDNLILPQSKAPTDWVTLDPDRFPRLSFTTDQGKYTGIYKAPEDLAKMINNYLADPSTSPNVVLKGLNTIANWTSSVKNRVLSFGVPGTAVNAHGFNILARNVMASKNPIEGAVTGIKYMLHPESAAKYLDSELIKAPDAVKHGLTLSANEFKSVLEEPQGFKTKFGDTWYKLFEKGLFDRMLPALKLQKYQEVVDGFIKSGMDETLAKRNAAKFTNDVFGGINWEEFGKSRDWQNIKRMFILAPDWLETNINLAKKTAKSTVNFSDKSLSAYRRFLATFLGSYVTMNVVNKLSSGHWMYQNDSGNTFNIEAGYTSDGQKRYIRPFGTAADFIRIPYDVANSLSQGDLQAPARVVRNRLSIPAGVGLGVFFDTDYTGQPIGWKGTDKYGGEMPAKQRLMGVGGELATLAGFPAFMKQGLDYTSGKTGLEQSLLQGLELPFRYSGGAYNKTQQKISDILKEQGASGEELYNANKGIKGLTFSDKDIQKIKVGGLDKFNEIQQSKENSAELKSKLKGEGYYTSKDAPKNLIEKTIVGTQALVTDPKQLVRAIFTKERLRKVENGFVVLERKEGLGQLDTEDKSTQIDHIVPLEFGGTNPTKSNEKILEETKGMILEQRNAYLKKYNLEALDTQEHDLKTKYQNYLSAELKAKRMTKKEVTTKMANWKEEILKLPENVMGKIVKDALAVEDTETDNNNEVKTSGKIYTIKTTTTDSEGVETTTSKDYDITRPIEEPKYTGQAELDKKLKSAYKSSLIKRINDIVKVYEDGQIPADEAEKLIAEVKQLQGKSGTGRAKTLKIGKTSKLKSPTIKISSSIPKVSVHSPSIKISMPKTSQSKVKLPTFKKANLANNTVKVKQFRQPVVKIKNG